MNLTSDNWISILSILLSIVVAFWTTYFTIKHNHKKEKSKGKIILIELIKRYFAICYNSFDKETFKIINDEISKQRYLRIIERIEQDLLELQNNLYYSSMLEKYPSITMVQVQLSCEVVAQKIDKTFFMQKETGLLFYELYEFVKKDLSKKYVENERFTEIISFAKNYTDLIEKRHTQQCSK